MAWRGRGRRPPGGFARHDITLKDDTGSDVPERFPPVGNMPNRAPTEEQMEPETLRLLSRYNKMRAAFHASPFHMEVEAKKEPRDTQPDVQTFVERQQEAQKARHKGKAALHHVVYMHKTYMPAELYSAKEARASLKKRKAPAHPNAAPRDTDTDLNALAKAAEDEQQGEQGRGKDGTGEKDKDEDDDSDKDEDDNAREDQDDEHDQEDDDYYQGEHFDDDDEYGIDDDDGEGEAWF